MSGRAGRWVIIHRAPLVLVRGWQAGDLLRLHGFKPLWSGVGRGWVVDDGHLADVAAIASMKTTAYRLEHDNGDDCQCAVAPRERRTVEADPSCRCDELGPLPPELDLLGAEEIGHAHREAAA